MGVETELAELKEYDKILEGYLNHALATIPQVSNNKMKVLYLRDYSELSLLEIADEIHLSYQRVKEISAALNKERCKKNEEYEWQLIEDTIKKIDGKSNGELRHLLKELCKKVKQGL